MAWAAMAQRALKRSYEDLAALPDNVVGELVDGELFANPRPALRHASVASRLLTVLGGPFGFGIGGPGGWILLFEPELHLGHDVLVPDIAGWRRERFADDLDAAAAEVAPDWVCEVLSSGTAVLDRERKMRVYAREGVRWAWLVDPAVSLLETFALDQGSWRVGPVWSGNAKVHAEPFDAIELDLGVIWTW
jgi:Uma2 family endonuclease